MRFVPNTGRASAMAWLEPAGRRARFVLGFSHLLIRRLTRERCCNCARMALCVRGGVGR